MAGKLSKLFRKETFLPSARKEQFWFETTDDSLLQPGDVKCDCENFVVYVFKDVKKDENGQECELVDVKFFPYLLNKRKGIITNIKTGKESPISKTPEELRGYKKQKNALKLLNYMGFVADYYDYIEKAFPNNNMEKCLDCDVVRIKYNMTTGDFIKICEKTAIEFKNSEQKRLKTKQAQTAKKAKKKEGTPNF